MVWFPTSDGWLQIGAKFVTFMLLRDGVYLSRHHISTPKGEFVGHFISYPQLIDRSLLPPIFIERRKSPVRRFSAKKSHLQFFCHNVPTKILETSPPARFSFLLYNPHAWSCWQRKNKCCRRHHVLLCHVTPSASSRSRGGLREVATENEGEKKSAAAGGRMKVAGMSALHVLNIIALMVSCSIGNISHDPTQVLSIPFLPKVNLNLLCNPSLFFHMCSSNSASGWQD